MMKVLWRANVKKKTKRLKGLKFRTFIGRFQVTGGSEGVKKKTPYFNQAMQNMCTFSG